MSCPCTVKLLKKWKISQVSKYNNKIPYYFALTLIDFAFTFQISTFFVPLCGDTNLNMKYFKHTFTNLLLSSCFLNMITFILAAWKRYEKIYYCFANSLQMLRLITLFLFLSCSSPSLDTFVSLSPVSSSKVSVTPPGCTLVIPKASRNSVLQLSDSVSMTHWVPLCTRARAGFLGQVHLVHSSSKL